MTLLVVFLCLAGQRYLPGQYDKPNFNWILFYYRGLERFFAEYSWWQGSLGVAILIAGLILGYVAVIMTLLHALGVVVTFLFNLVVLWFYLEARPLQAKADESVFIPEIFMGRYQAIFAVLFWYVVLGPLGAILYAELRKLELHLKTEKHEDVYFSTGFLDKLNVVRSWMDWIPVRLLGLTFALVGQFRPAFQMWLQNFRNRHDEPLVVDYGLTALNWDLSSTLSGSATELVEIEALITRALIVWVVVIGVFTLGQWL